MLAQPCLAGPGPSACRLLSCASCPQAYDAALAAKKEAAAAAKQESGGGGGGGLPAGLKLEDPSVLLQPGARDGQQKYIREGGTCWVYAWDAAR